MKYNGRITGLVVMIVVIQALREYGVLYYNYPPYGFPFISLGLAPVFWWLGKQYDMVKFLSENDPLTKIYNRRYIYRIFPKISVLMDRKNEKLILFFVDINNFKIINDKDGHEIGDEVLKHLSNLLVKITRKKDIVARLAGDEFIIITPFIEINGMDRIINHINNELRKLSEELNIDISVSIGTSVYPNDAKTLDGLLSIADQNMYKQKSLKDANY
ncbi:GGDEF domain-containing protein [Ectobacillus sp. sgz5001026]|uniref:GGDEF domain-containing protein n=1 Tax=Ectobacillus sp. sgz5001026 TaxID=3242473 RepID=UPI0036D3EBF8